MSPAAAFLTALARVLSTLHLYAEGHPSRERTIDRAHEHLRSLQESEPDASFTFLGEDVLYRGRPFRELGAWDWGDRLASVGVQRLEFTGPVERDDFEAFVDDVHRKLTGESGTAGIRQSRPTRIRYGVVRVDSDEDREGEEGGEDREMVTATLHFDLGDEAETVRWLHDELEQKGELHLLEAESIVRSLSVAMHGDQAFLIPLLRLKEFDQYTTTHSLNVATLSMALAEHLELGPREVRAFGIAGLLHDMGKVRIPNEILNKPGKLTDAERRVMNRHPVDGAKIILETGDFLDLAAVVAYEHHIRIDGGGYPAFHYERRCHEASNLVHVCDVFDALRTHRPYRDGWPTERILAYIEEGAGSEFEAEVAGAFVRMMRRWRHRVAEVEEERERLPLGQSPRESNGDDRGSDGDVQARESRPTPRGGGA